MLRDLDLCELKELNSEGFYSEFHKACPTFYVEYLLTRVYNSSSLELIDWVKQLGWYCDPPVKLLIPREFL